MSTLVGLRHPAPILVTDFTSPDDDRPDKLTNDLLILKVDCDTLQLCRALKQSE